MKVLKAISNREALAKVVRLLTSSNITVQFRGYRPFVESKGNKVVRLVLPEMSDDAPEALMKAMHGFLDHEVGHIYFTPFARMHRFVSQGGDAFAKAIRPPLSNILEDIRLEKLLPRELPGTKENLERMYEEGIGFYFGPPVLAATQDGVSSQSFCAVLVVGLRALSGQKAFQRFMDDNKLWDHLKPLIVAMPDLSRRLRSMETYEDVEELTDDIIDAVRPPEPEKKEEQDKDNQKDDQKDDDDKGQPGPPDKEKDKSDKGKADKDTDDDGDGEADDDADADGCSGDKSDKTNGKGEDSDDGDESDTDGDESGDDGDDGEDDGSDGEQDFDKGSDDDYKPGSGKQNKSITDALKMLEPTQRKAIFMYKKQHKPIAEIATELGTTEDGARDLVASARRRLNQIMKGA